MIYVDEMGPCLANRNWRWHENCHLFCDGDLEKLHAFAKRIGLKRAWFQDNSDLPHYDLTRPMRDRAVANGASQVDRKTTALWIGAWRELTQLIGKQQAGK